MEERTRKEPPTEQGKCAHVMVGRVCQKCGVVAVPASGTYEPPPKQSGTLITDEIVERAWEAGRADLGENMLRWDKSALRAALQAIEGDIIEEFGASGCKPEIPEDCRS